ncbi:MAG: prepilin peptidase, partial [Acidimicrobiales bacterium]
CGARLRAADNIPLISWLVLGAKCRSCKCRISFRYPAIEALTAALFVAAAARLALAPELVAYWVFFAALVAVSAIDIERFVVPRKIVYVALGLAGPLLALQAVTSGQFYRLVDAAIGGALSFGFMALVHLVQPRGMGFGDVRLAGLDGVLLGWLGLPVAAIGLFLGFVSAATFGLVLLALGHSRKTKLPFAPFLALGAVSGTIAGPALARLWLG